MEPTVNSYIAYGVSCSTKKTFAITIHGGDTETAKRLFLAVAEDLNIPVKSYTIVSLSELKAGE